LAKTINKNYKLQINFRWTTVYSGDIENNNPVKASHVISSSESQIEAKNQFNNIYHLGKTTFPMGMRMGFIPLLH
jgi:hypothetical protein